MPTSDDAPTLPILRQQAIALFTRERRAQAQDFPTMLVLAALSTDDPAQVRPLVQQAHGLVTNDPQHLAHWAHWAAVAHHPAVASTLCELGLDWTSIDPTSRQALPLWSTVLNLDAATVLDPILRTGGLPPTQVLTGLITSPLNTWEPHRPWLAQALTRHAFACAGRLWQDEAVRTDPESLDQALWSMVPVFQNDRSRVDHLDEKVAWVARLLDAGANPMRAFAHGNRLKEHRGEPLPGLGYLPLQWGYEERRAQWPEGSHPWASQADRDASTRPVDATMEYGWPVAYDLLREALVNMEYYPEQGRALWNVLRDRIDWAHVPTLPCGAGLIAVGIQVAPSLNEESRSGVNDIMQDLLDRGVPLTATHPAWNPVELWAYRAVNFHAIRTLRSAMAGGTPITPLDPVTVQHLVTMVEDYAEDMFDRARHDDRGVRRMAWFADSLRGLTPAMPEGVQRSWDRLIQEGEKAEAAWVAMGPDQRATQRAPLMEAHHLRAALAMADAQSGQVPPPRVRPRL